MRYFKQLKVWKRAHVLALDVYCATSNYPTAEKYGLTSQMRRSATSVPTNLAEGAARHSRADYARFIDIAVGSVTEIEYQLILSDDLGYLESQRSTGLQRECREIRSMLLGLRSRVLTTDD